MHGAHRSALPQFLAFATRLQAVVDEPTFAPVLSTLRKGVTTSGWRHVLLQLEVARAARRLAVSASFEPNVPGGDRKADLLLNDGVAPNQLVETMTLLRAVPDMDWHDYEDSLTRAMFSVEHEHGVSTAMLLTNHMDEVETETWLTQITEAAARVRATGISETVEASGNTVAVHAQSLELGMARFTGASWFTDGWRRLGRALREKARQSAGPMPAWLRIDAADGFFQFTDWTKHSWPDRICELRDAVAREGLDDLTHLQGVVLSCGSAVCLGATDPQQEDRDAEAAGAVGLRKLLAPHLVRETFIIPLRDEAGSWAVRWHEAYRTEPVWLDDDLAALGLPPFAKHWKG
jgi:hypothetical protein